MQMRLPFRWLSILITGAPGSGKSTLANLVGTYMDMRELRPEYIDGDTLRAQYKDNLGWSRDGILEQARRASLAAQGAMLRGRRPVISLCAPLRECHKIIMNTLQDRLDLNFRPVLHIVCDAPFDIRKERREQLYTRYTRGQLESWIDQETPTHTYLRLNSHTMTKQQMLANCVMAIEALTK